MQKVRDGGFEKYKSSRPGLTIVKKYVEMHRGSIRVKSEPDKGSSFIFEIPLHQ